MKRTVLLTLLPVLAVTTAHADDYVIDAAGAGMHASINFKASHISISPLWGRFNELSGRFTYDADDIEASSITVNINPASVDTNHGARDTHLRTSDYLHVDNYPTASFTSTSVEDLGNGRVRINGTFTLHGVTRDISFEAVRTGEGETPFGDYRVGFEGELVLNAGDYGINAGPVELVLAIEGIRQ